MSINGDVSIFRKGDRLAKTGSSHQFDIIADPSYQDGKYTENRFKRRR